MKHKLWAKVKTVVLAVTQVGCLVHCVTTYIGSIVYCSGTSMKPAIDDTDIVLTENFSVRHQKLLKGDVVISVSPENPRVLICKRLIAFSGDHVYNDLENTIQYVPRGHVWLEGDNKMNSSDSRNYGPVPYGLLRGRVCLKIWPLLSMGKIPFTDVFDWIFLIIFYTSWENFGN